MKSPTYIKIQYNFDYTGTFSVPREDCEKSIWTRIKLAIRSKNIDHNISECEINLSWPDTLGIVRELGSKSNQINLNFRFQPEGKAVDKISSFATEIQKIRQIFNQKIKESLSWDEINFRLKDAGFTKRELKDFQLRDISHLLALSNGANFSVPGSGKTTVTFALHILTIKSNLQFMVVAPKAAFQAWIDIVNECMEKDTQNNGSEPFTLLTGNENEISDVLNSEAKRFIISYDMVLRHQNLLSYYIANKPTHLVLDESHRMKAGWQSQRGAFFLRYADCPVRRDILTGTPMPQASSDMESQLDFLWPGHGYGQEISRGKSPREVLGNLYVRTTKTELKLPKVNRKFIDVSMDPGQLILYSIIRNEFVRSFSKSFSKGLDNNQLYKARRSVMRLLQLSINPTLALTKIINDEEVIESAIVDQVLDEENSEKMRQIIDHAYSLASEGKKCVIWTIFTDTIHSFTSSLADLNAVFIHGGVSSGSIEDPDSREGRIHRFHKDNGCYVLVANPAATGEGISLHTVCHNAIYADRSYVSTHYLQSIDRIHRLGLPPDQETNIFIYRTKAPPVIGSIDMSVNRRLRKKIRNMQILLDDTDLHEIALDEEKAGTPAESGVEIDDILDLISELEGPDSKNSMENNE